MVSERQPTSDPDFASAPVVGRVDFSHPDVVPLHAHARHQLSYAIAGVLHLSTSVGQWVLPPSRALWIRAGIEHSTTVKRPADIRTFYIDPTAYKVQDHSDCMVVEVTPLVRELILACAKFPWNYSPHSSQARLARVLVDQFEDLDLTSVNIPLPVDSRALRVANILRDEPSNREPLSVLSQRVGASARTVERLFIRETNMSFGAWRQRQRLIFALERLAYGESVKNVAEEVGYDSPSNFVVAFRSLFGTTPARYFKEIGASSK